MKTRLVDIAPYEEAGWFLTQRAVNRHGRECISSKPLSALPTVETPMAEFHEDEPKVFEFPPAFRVRGEDGKASCSVCRRKLAAVKTPYCPGCGHRFVEEEAADYAE